MATTRLNLTRDQLATFLKDHEQIRQFERLFADVNQLEPTTLVDLAITASTAGQQAVEALDALNRIANGIGDGRRLRRLPRLTRRRPCARFRQTWRRRRPKHSRR
jgi:hypothetical protein